ncbi:hypothetical protein [Maribacter halichondriae]|uniref:hypothetical protein n=1 Tax=Maribacter halichondriae TaxID=2980554 RepID=UPI002359440F|nr:hypothetical protein [Maribacter sp. Hal144]
MKKLRIIYFLMIAMLMACNSSTKQEKDKEESLAETNIPKVVTADIEAGIKANIDKRVAEGDGYFYMEDAEGQELRLQLVRVHTEYLSNLGPRRHFACVDLADISGDVYDVDFFLEGDPGNMSVTETTLHKLNGKPFYTWKRRKDKTWYRVPMQNASNDLLGVIEGVDKFEFHYEVTLPEMTEGAQLWIPFRRAIVFKPLN